VIGQQYPFDMPVFKPLRLTFPEGIKMLQDAGTPTSTPSGTSTQPQSDSSASGKRKELASVDFNIITSSSIHWHLLCSCIGRWDSCNVFSSSCPQTQVEAKIKALKDVVAVDDVEGMKKGMEELQQEAMKMGQAMYGSQGGAPGAEGGAAPGAGAAPGSGPEAGKKAAGDDVIDAEFTN